MNAGVIAALLLSYLAPSINPKTFWPLAFFGMAYFPILLLNLLFVLLWLFRKPVYSLLSAITVLAGWNALQLHVGMSASVPQEALAQRAEDQLRVMSYNVHLFSAPEFDAKPFTNAQNISAVIAQVSPDVLCLQEFHTRFKGEHHMIHQFEKELGYTHHYVFPVAENNREAYGMAIFSKYPIVDTGSIEGYAYGINRMIYSDIVCDGQKIRVYNVHLRSIGFKKEDYEFIKNPSGTFNQDMQSTLMIGGRLKNAFHSRSDQVEALVQHAAQIDYPYMILGDFNDTPLSYAVNKASKNLKNTFREKGRGWGTTYNGDFPNFQIDFIFVHPSFDVQHYQIIQEKLSDHYPVWADLRFATDSATAKSPEASE